MTDNFLKTANITDNENDKKKDEILASEPTPFEVKMVLAMTFVAGMAYW